MAATSAGPPDQLAATWALHWKKGSTRLEIYGGISADAGDDPDVTYETVRGRQAEVVPPSSAGGAMVVSWNEGEGACSYQYAVVGTGIAEAELLRVARSLKRS